MATGSPPRKIDKLRALMAAGDWQKALSLAARWPQLGDQRDAIRMGHAAASNPSFYRQMGHDPEALLAAGVAALKARYPTP